MILVKDSTDLTRIYQAYRSVTAAPHFPTIASIAGLGVMAVFTAWLEDFPTAILQRLKF